MLKLPLNEEHEELNVEPFSKMNKLRLLKICKLHLPCLSNLSNELRMLEWQEYPLKSLPKGFQPPKLVELIMHRSGIKQLPREFGVWFSLMQLLLLLLLLLLCSDCLIFYIYLIVLSQHLYKLKLIDLSDSQNLCQTPNFSGLPNIERLIF